MYILLNFNFLLDGNGCFGLSNFFGEIWRRNYETDRPFPSFSNFISFWVTVIQIELRKLLFNNSTACHWECYWTQTAWSINLIFREDMKKNKRNRYWPPNFFNFIIFRKKSARIRLYHTSLRLLLNVNGWIDESHFSWRYGKESIKQILKFWIIWIYYFLCPSHSNFGYLYEHI